MHVEKQKTHKHETNLRKNQKLASLYFLFYTNNKHISNKSVVTAVFRKNVKPDQKLQQYANSSNNKQ